MTTPVKNPLVTYLFLAYNQQEFVREAVISALSQTYTPMQIIISDDCSPDATYEIMAAEVAKYQGSNEIVLRQNNPNLGIGGHINQLMELARGELIVVAAGDDVSLPNRVERIVAEWNKAPNEINSLYSKVEVMDESGRHIRYLGSAWDNSTTLPAAVQSLCMGVLGASHAWHRRIFDVFGPMLSDSMYEDRILSMRSLLLGKIVYIDEPLVQYRAHEANTSVVNRKIMDVLNFPKERKRIVLRLQRISNVLDNYERVILTARTLNDGRKYVGALEAVVDYKRGNEIETVLWSSGLFQRLNAFRSLCSVRAESSRLIKGVVLAVSPFLYFYLELPLRVSGNVHRLFQSRLSHTRFK